MVRQPVEAEHPIEHPIELGGKENLPRPVRLGPARPGSDATTVRPLAESGRLIVPQLGSLASVDVSFRFRVAPRTREESPDLRLPPGAMLWCHCQRMS